MDASFMLYIRNTGNAKANWDASRQLAFVKQCEAYISRLKDMGALIAAQPLEREGMVITQHGDNWTHTPVNPESEIQVGYYHIQAKDMDAAIAIAKENPEFEYVPGASIEVRPVKAKEERTSFVYPDGRP